jgi:hypothetical protein
MSHVPGRLSTKAPCRTPPSDLAQQSRHWARPGLASACPPSSPATDPSSPASNFCVSMACRGASLVWNPGWPSRPNWKVGSYRDPCCQGEHRWASWARCWLDHDSRPTVMVGAGGFQGRSPRDQHSGRSLVLRTPHWASRHVESVANCFVASYPGKLLRSHAIPTRPANWAHCDLCVSPAKRGRRYASPI